MTITRVEVMKLGLIAWLLAGSLLVPVTSGATTPPLPSISVNAGNGLGIIHFAPIGTGIFMDALLSVVVVVPEVHVDVYVGAIVPDGWFVSWVGGPQAPTLVGSTSPVPFLANVVPAETKTFRLAHTFATGEPQGWYWLYGLVVNAGADPLDPRSWIDTFFFPLLVTPPVPR
jgi:hypothetical protein